jgi:hypothetical protein
MILLAGGICLLFSAACGLPENQATVRLESEAGYRLAMDRENGFVVFFGKEENLLVDAREPLFKVRFLDPDGHFPCMMRMTPENARFFSNAESWYSNTRTFRTAGSPSASA